uniref:Rubredoxin-like domain-containing protein n=1 Tax=Salix viminalis TaxID=40686 RepID=A0A6N2NIF6_SALVM
MEEAKRDEEESKQQQIWSWGAGTEGQLGTGKLEDEYLPQLLHLPFLSSAGSISTLACGGAHAIALTSVGKVFTWGRGTTGQLGHGEMLNSLHPKPVITHVSAGWSHSGFVSDIGLLFTCGDGSFGQLGLGDYRSQSTPVKVDYFANNFVNQIACGMRHSLVLLMGNCSGKPLPSFLIQRYICATMKSSLWLVLERGQLGSRDKIKSVNLPQVTCGLEDVQIVSISANGDHSAAISADGHLYTWGRGFAGAADANLPQLSLSSLRCQLLLDGIMAYCDEEVLMLGGNYHGGLCDLEKMSAVKHRSGLDGVKVVKIAAGAEHSALVTGKTWGWGEHGQLGLGNTNDQTIPQTVSLSPDIQNKEASLTVYCGSGFTFAIRSLSVNPDRGHSSCLFCNDLLYNNAIKKYLQGIESSTPDETKKKRKGRSPAKMAVQLHAPTRLQATKTLPLPSLLGPNGNNVGLKGPADRFALKSSFFSPSLHLLIASYNQKQSLASAAPRFSMRAATKQAYICRDCGYIYNDRKPFDRLPDNYFCPGSVGDVLEDDPVGRLKGNAIQASAKGKNIQAFAASIVEGHYYQVCGFYTFENRYTNSIVAHEAVIDLKSDTKVTRIDPITPPIPRHYFNFIDFAHLMTTGRRSVVLTGKPNLASTVASLWYVNPEIQEILPYKHYYKDIPVEVHQLPPTTNTLTIDQQLKENRKTIKEILSMGDDRRSLVGNADSRSSSMSMERTCSCTEKRR